MINIIFEDNIDFYFARQRVLERLTLASTFLPPGVVPYLAPDATALGQIFWYTVEGEGQDLGRLRAIQDWYVRYQLNSVPGVAQVASAGGFPIEYQIDVDPNKLRAYNVTLGELFAAVAQSNSAVGGKVIQKGNAEYIVRGVGWIERHEGHREDRRQGRPGKGHADLRLQSRHGEPGGRVPPQRAGEERQRGGRGRGDDAARREPAGGDQADQGQDSRASAGPAAKACGSCPSTTAPG